MAEQNISHKIIRSTVFNILGRAWGILIALFLTPYIIRYIGVERYGVWALVGVLTGYFGLLDLGIGYAFSKYIAEFHAKKDYAGINRIVNTGFVFYSVFAVVIIILAFLNIDFLVACFKIPAVLHEEVSFVFLLAIVIFGFYNVFSSFFAVQAGMQRFDIYSKISMITSVPSVIGTIFFLKNGYGLGGLMINNAIVFALGSILNFIVVFRLLPELRFNPFLSSVATFKKLFGFGFKIQVSRFAGLFHFQMDKFLLAYFLDVGFVTFYSVASQIASKLTELPIMIVSVIQPAASELDAKLDKARLGELYSRSMKYVILLLCSLAIPVLSLAKPFIRLWLGQGYEYSAVTLQFLSCAYFINVLTGPGYCILNGIGKPQYAMRCSMIGIVLNAVLSIILVMRIGYFGVVIGTTAALSATSIYFLFLFYKVSSLSFAESFYKVFLRPAIAAALSFLIGSVIIARLSVTQWGGLILAGAIYAGLFWAVVFLIGYVDSYDKVLINRYTKLKIFRIEQANK